MSTLYLVRHGQASFGKEDYDQLSDLGFEQAKVVGEYLAKITEPALFVSGSLKRQRQTLQQVKKGFNAGVIEGAKSLELPAFNEFDHRNILEVVHPKLRETHKEILATLTTSPNALKTFLVLYKEAIRRWVNNEGDFKETFSAFTQRISKGISELIQLAEPNQNIILVSSAGPISSCVQFGMNISSETAFLLSETMVNTGVTALNFDESRILSLSFFNSFQHLVYADSEVTYR